MRSSRYILRLPRYLWELLCAVFMTAAAGLINLFSDLLRDVWIVSERGTDARDNGYWFYKYIREKHPEIKAYYIIKKDSPDFAKIEALGGAVNYRSFKHRLLFAASAYKISTHIYGYSPDVQVCYNLLERLKLIRGKRVFLQHGIIMNRLERAFYPATRLDLFVSGAGPEYEYLRLESGYPDGVVQYLGLCRYDNLLKPHEVKNRILFMPSWRLWSCEGGREAFASSRFFHGLCALIENRRLISCLEDNNIELVFYPHYEVQKYLDMFESRSDKVTIASFRDYDVQELLMTSRLLITDFSSVSFDFAYMGRPLIYYQFDEDDFRAQNYKKGYFDYYRDGFGPVLTECGETVDKIIFYIENRFRVDEEYRLRGQRFFEQRDDRNTERNFRAVLNL